MRARIWRGTLVALLVSCAGEAGCSSHDCAGTGTCSATQSAGTGGKAKDSDASAAGGASSNTTGGRGIATGGAGGNATSGASSNTTGGRGTATGGTGGNSTGGRGGATAGAGGTSGATSNGGACAASAGAAYDDVVLCDQPVAYWAMSHDATEPDLSGNSHDGTYQGGAPAQASLPNGDSAADFNGSSQYLTVPSSSTFSISTTGSLTWEAWIRPDMLQFPHASGDGYVDWMGKCASYSPSCEWEARMYSTMNAQMRCNRLSVYVFNPTAGLGSGADWQPVCGLLQPNEWLHVVGEYTTSPSATPSGCASSNPTEYPGAINIWVNGVKWNQSKHGDTGCFGQYMITPKANNSPINIGTMSKDTWFKGAIGKVAIYAGLLTQAQITSHYQAMSGQAPSGSCADTCSF